METERRNYQRNEIRNYQSRSRNYQSQEARGKVDYDLMDMGLYWI